MKSISTNEEAPEAVALHESLWRGLYGMGSKRKAPVGSILFREGEPVRGLFLLASGSVRLSLGKNGRSITYRVANPKYILGLPATLLHRPYSLTAEVLEEAEFYFVASGDAMDYLREHADICMHVLEFLSHEMVWIRHIHAAQLENTRSPLV